MFMYSLLVDFATERSDSNLSKLKALLAERNTDNGDAPKNSCEKEAHCKTKTTKDDPNEVRDWM